MLSNPQRIGRQELAAHQLLENEIFLLSTN
jgi:hypothetical protein